LSIKYKDVKKIFKLRKFMNPLFKNVTTILESNFKYLFQIFSRDNDMRFLSQDGMRIFWTNEISSDLAKSINTLLDCSLNDKSLLIKLTRTRSVATGVLPQADSTNKKIFIKRYIIKNRLKGILNFITPSKAWREMYLTLKLVNLGIPTTKPLLVAEKRCNSILKECYLITEGIPDAQTFLSLIKQESFQKQKEKLLLKLASFISLVHNEGFFHADLSLKNILVSSSSDNSLKLFVMDIDKGVFLKNIPSLWRAKNFFQIFRHTKDIFTEEDKRFLIDSYCKISNSLTAEKLWRDIKRVKLYSIVRDSYRRLRKTYFKRNKREVF